MVVIAIVVLITSFTTTKDIYPCHPAGDLGPCTHRVHAGDYYACTHYDAWGNRMHNYDIGPCGHWVHANDIYPCTHICY